MPNVSETRKRNVKKMMMKDEENENENENENEGNDEMSRILVKSRLK